MEENINDYLSLIHYSNEYIYFDRKLLQERNRLGKRIWLLLNYAINKNECDLVEFETGINPIAFTRRYSFEKYKKVLFILLSDKFGSRCALCGTTDKLTIDHKIPLSRGGSNHIDNLQILCLSCNDKKGIS